MESINALAAVALPAESLSIWTSSLLRSLYNIEREQSVGSMPCSLAILDAKARHSLGFFLRFCSFGASGSAVKGRTCVGPGEVTSSEACVMACESRCSCIALRMILLEETDCKDGRLVWVCKAVTRRVAPWSCSSVEIHVGKSKAFQVIRAIATSVGQRSGNIRLL